MDSLAIKPEKEQKTLWIITWIVVFVIGTILWIVLSLTVNLLTFGIASSVWLIIMILIVIWIPAAFNALEYYIDDEGVKMKGGVVWKKYVTVPYPKITNVDITRGPLQRYYNIGTIHVQTAGAAGKQGEKAELKLTGIRELDKIRDVIIKNVKDPTYSSGSIREPGKELIPEEKSTVFTNILDELKSIKRLLEEK